MIQEKINGLEAQKAALNELKSFATDVEAADQQRSESTFKDLLHAGKKGSKKTDQTREGIGNNQAFSLYALQECGGSGTIEAMHTLLHSIPAVPFELNGDRGQRTNHQITKQSILEAMERLVDREYVSADRDISTLAKTQSTTQFTLQREGRRELCGVLGLEFTEVVD